jgi:hypothetical protein
MMGDLEALGDAVTGGVVGRAVEPKAGEASDGHTHETACLNCGTVLAGPYCSRCGQHAHVHRTLSAFFHDLVHGVLHFEGKIWRTLPLLAWRPGELTRRYIDGQRASFVSPIALFLFCVFLMFAVMGLTGSMFGEGIGNARQGLEQELRADQRRLARLEERRQEAVKSGAPTAEIDRKLKSAKEEIAAIHAVQAGKVPENDIKLDGVDGLPGWIGSGISKATKNPELTFYKVKTNAYKFSWALIPISVPFVWLLFPFSRRFRLYDHTVFVTYSLCFMMLLLIASTLVGLVAEWLASLAWLVPPIHMYRQLKGTYAVSRGGAIWRAAALTIFAFIAIGLFSSLLVAIGAFE